MSTATNGHSTAAPATTTSDVKASNGAAGDGVYLKLTPYKLEEVPSTDALLAAAKSIIAEARTWKKGKTFNNKKVGSSVTITSKPKGPKDGAGWYARHSVHTAEQGTFKEFWEGLAIGKAVKEKEYIPELKDVTLLQNVATDQSIWSLYYEFPPPVSPRVFCALQTTREPLIYDNNPGEWQEAYIISLPIEPTAEQAAKEKKGVRARYVSIEYIKELEGGKVEWIMATSSTPAGLIPGFVAELSMPGSIAPDVPHFLEWLAEQRRKRPEAGN